MSDLSRKSADEISEMLDEYGIKHGPVVDSTRSLYEKKLREAMSKEKATKYSKASPDKTYYREEEEEVTYVYRTPAREEPAGDFRDRASYLSSRPNWAEREYEQDRSPAYPRSRPEFRGRDFVDERYINDSLSSYQSPSVKSVPLKPAPDAAKPPDSPPLIPKWVQVVFFVAVAAFLYLVFSNMETNETLKEIQ